MHTAREKTSAKLRKNSGNSQNSGGISSGVSSSGNSNNVSAEKFKAGGKLQGSGASLSNVLPKTTGAIRLTLQVKGHKQFLKMIRQTIKDICIK